MRAISVDHESKREWDMAPARWGEAFVLSVRAYFASHVSYSIL